MWHLFGRTGEVINVDEEAYNQWQMWHLFGRTGKVINVDEETYNQWQMWHFVAQNDDTLLTNLSSVLSNVGGWYKVKRQQSITITSSMTTMPDN